MSHVWKFLGRREKSNPEISFSHGETFQTTQFGKRPSKRSTDLVIPLFCKEAEFVDTAVERKKTCSKVMEVWKRHLVGGILVGLFSSVAFTYFFPLACVCHVCFWTFSLPTAAWPFAHQRCAFLPCICNVAFLYCTSFTHHRASIPGGCSSQLLWKCSKWLTVLEEFLHFISLPFFITTCDFIQHNGNTKRINWLNCSPCKNFFNVVL